jgi:hypothetical protein
VYLEYTHSDMAVLVVLTRDEKRSNGTLQRSLMSRVSQSYFINIIGSYSALIANSSVFLAAGSVQRTSRSPERTFR